jgi:MoxR-like ATPase
VVLTSNRTRELHDALKRRCLFHWIDYPDPAREAEIIRVRCPDVPERLARGVVEAVGRLRELDLLKRPGIAESIDWARALAALGVETLGRAEIERTLGVALKEREDLERARAQAAALAG